MKIGALAQATGTPVETIRYYERESLLPTPSRTRGNYRYYTELHLERLLFIRHCRVLDMSHDEIRRLLQWRDHPLQECGNVNALIDSHILHLTERINALQALETQLRNLRMQCSAGRDVEQCGILRQLANVPSSDAPNLHNMPHRAVSSLSANGGHSRS